MTAPAPHGPGFGRHEPSVKHTNADAETLFVCSFKLEAQTKILGDARTIHKGVYIKDSC